MADDARKDLYDRLALEPPRITALADAPLAAGEAYRDSFNLAYWLGPVYDILRHPRTRTPLAVALYGSWGAGKTTAMRWLEGLLERWNRLPPQQAAVRLRTVWFLPWKYQSREDVWRGLIAEVILKCLDLGEADARTVAKAARQLGLFLGRSFLHVLAGFKVKGAAGAEAEAGLGGLEKIPEAWERYVHPEKAYLNEFEATLKSWIRDTLGPNDRLLVFIDDLDRCLPEVALEVLEALKLYLDLEQLVFVVGVDRPVIEQLVQKHYEDLGLEAGKSRQYLSKMFQIEIDLAPSAAQIERYLDDQLEHLPYWSEALDGEQKAIFRNVVLQLAGRNPREVKRLVNSALMRGVGAQRSDAQGLTFGQGLQLFFVRRRLARLHPRQRHLVGHPQGDELFGQWSRRVRGLEVEAEALAEEALAERLGAAPEEVRALLDDGLLGELMRIEYPLDTSGVAEAFEIDPWLLPRVARQLGKPPEEVTRREYLSVEGLDLRGIELADLEPLRGLLALRRLDLTGARVADLSPLAGLGALRRLHLARTEVRDLAPLAGLAALEVLYLNATRVADLEPLRGLEALRSLRLTSTEVADLRPLQGLVRLEHLDLANTEVEDVRPLAALQRLERLNLSSTRVRDLAPLAALGALKKLSLWGTRVTEAEVEALRRQLPGLELELLPEVDLRGG